MTHELKLDQTRSPDAVQMDKWVVLFCWNPTNSFPCRYPFSSSQRHPESCALHCRACTRDIGVGEHQVDMAGQTYLPSTWLAFSSCACSIGIRGVALNHISKVSSCSTWTRKRTSAADSPTTEGITITEKSGIWWREEKSGWQRNGVDV